MTLKEKRVLSIQSHVVCGYVGNKAAVFPLQLLGIEVDVINTVEFSNHTGYGKWAGTKLSPSHLKEVFEAMDGNKLLRQTHLLTGYIPGAEALQTVSSMVDRLKEVNPDLTYVLDPVMGDDGKIYVSPDVVPVYKSLLPKATVATPNAFEAELLTEVKITSLQALKTCLNTFHKLYNIPNILISSCEEGLFEGSLDSDYLICAGSSMTSNGPTEAFMIRFPKLAEHFEGVGDLFSALVTARIDLDTIPLSRTAELAIASLQAIIANTRHYAAGIAAKNGINLLPNETETPQARINRLRTIELRIVPNPGCILDPVIEFKAQPL